MVWLQACHLTRLRFKMMGMLASHVAYLGFEMMRVMRAT